MDGMSGGGGMGGYGGYAQIIGGVMQGLAASNAARAMGRAYQSELARQGYYRGQAVTSMNKWLPTLGSEQAGQDMAQGMARRENAYATGRDQSLMQGQGQSARDDAYYDLTGRNRARQAAYGDWGVERGIRAGREGQTLDKIINFAQGDASVLPYRMYKAQHSMDQLAFFGQLISSLGGGATNLGQQSDQQPPSIWTGGAPQATVSPGTGMGVDYYNAQLYNQSPYVIAPAAQQPAYLTGLDEG